MLLNRHSGCAAFHNQRINKFKNLPLHVTPSPLYPGLQAHVKDPSVLVQEALGSQGNWTIHSSISADGKIVRKTRLKHCEPLAPAVISKLITSYNRSRHCYESVAAQYTLVHGLSCLMGGLPERTGQLHNTYIQWFHIPTCECGGPQPFHPTLAYVDRIKWIAAPTNSMILHNAPLWMICDTHVL